MNKTIIRVYLLVISVMLLLNAPVVLAYQQSEDSLSISAGSALDEPQLPEPKIENRQKSFWIYDENQPIFLIQVLIILIIFAIVVQLITLVWILINRNKLQTVQEKTSELMERYQTLLVDYLFFEYNRELFAEIKKIASSHFNKKILIDQMIDLSINLGGESKEKLKDLYLRLHLEGDSIEKANSHKWHIKIKGFKELAFMNIKVANEKVTKALKSKNDILRMESQLALVRLNEADPFKFLDDLKRPFTLWEQLNVHELIIFHNLPIPNFSRWTNSLNKTVVIFSLRMIQVFKQTHEVQAVIGCLSHSDDKVRNAAIKVCGEIHLKETLPHLKHMYKNEEFLNSLAIVQAMGKIPDESMLGFLKLVLDKEEDVQLQIAAALAIANMGEVGVSALVKLMKSEYKDYQIIIRHVLDKRIN